MKSILLTLLLFCQYFAYGQGINNNWITGYGGGFGDPDFGESTIDFFTGSASISLNHMEMDFRQTHANISDSSGNLLFFTNGYYIADANGDTMLNGTGINPSTFTNMFPDGLTIPQASLIIPKPDDSDTYFLFHTTIDTTVPLYAVHFLYLTEIDMSLNGGKGEVINKNQIVLNDSISIGKISAVKHGNGRDWWIIIPGTFSSRYIKLLVTPIGISSVSSQNIGIHTIPRIGQAGFNNSGNKYFHLDFNGEIELFDFDRCTGLYSNQILLNTTVGSAGACLSSNDRFLYSSATDSLFQFDLTAANVQASQTLVAVYDSFLSAGAFPLPTFFEHMALAPDGKIYMTTGNGTQHYHIIDQPDSLGTACNVIQHGLNLGHYYYNTLPNHPNYHLGPLVGSVCDTVYTGIPPPEERLTLKLYPSPNSGAFQITYTPLPENLILQVFNILGEEVYSQLLPQWSQLQNIYVPNLTAGVYMATITSSASTKSVKFLVE